MTPEASEPHPLEVRAATASEFARVGRLVEQAYRDGGEIDDTDAYAEVLRDTQGRAKDTLLLVAVRDGRIVGSVTVLPAGARDCKIAREGELEFRFLAVAREAWGTGVSDALVRAVVDQADAQGLDLAMHTRQGNTAAERLYARHGFERLPDRDVRPRPDVRLLGMGRRATALAAQDSARLG